jgi:hypothetical protein
MDALDISARQGSLVLKKIISGTVYVSTDPAILLDSNKPKLVALGPAAVKIALAQSNIRSLVRQQHVAVVL